jgi:hypothetical protein
MRATTWSLAAAALAACFTFFTPQLAGADGIAVADSQIPTTERNKLWSEIEAYRATNPGIFDLVRDVQGHRPEVYKKRRNPVPYVGPELRRLKQAALLPMIEALAFQAPERGGLTEREWRALHVGLLEAVGVLRDSRAATVLQQAFANATHPEVIHAAGEALGRLCDDSSYQLLSKEVAGVKKLGAIVGLGQCRRIDSTERLAQLLENASDEAEAAAMAEALGVAASSWAWHTYGKAAQAQGLKVRRIAATALVPAFIRHQGKTREAVRVGLTMAEYPAMAQLVRQHRHRADEPTARALDRLVVRIQKRLNR